MTYLPFFLCTLLWLKTSYADPPVYEVVQLDASNVTGWRGGNCSYAAILCHSEADCQEGLLGSVQYYRCLCPHPSLGDGYADSEGCNVTSCGKDEDCHQYGECTAQYDGTYCQCRAGFTGDGAEVCNDIKECDALPGPCDENAICQDTQGSFTCTCDYVNNYKGNGFTCTHECTNPSHCHSYAECVNKKCTCIAGFTGTGVTCVDIDECQDPNACPAGSTCNNELGSFSCECGNGFDSKNGDCIALPLDCQDMRDKGLASHDGYYEIDPDFTGAANRFLVYCDFRKDYVVTEVAIDNVDSKIPAKGEHTFDYGTDHLSLQALLARSHFCYQSTLLTCTATFSYNDDFMWRDAYGQEHTSWAGSSKEGMCGCGELKKCPRCTCGSLLGGKDRDYGLFVDKTQLPVTYIRLGNSGGGQLSIGELKCGQRVFDIPQSCDEWRMKNPSGAYHIQLGGPLDSDPFLVYCDMDTYPHVAVTEVQVQQNDIPMPSFGTTDVTYIQDISDVLMLVDSSTFCIQRVQYNCQNSPITGGRVYVNVAADSRQLTYFPGADNVADSCGCGATQSCEDPAVRCDCDIEDGEMRWDLGDIINKADLPVRSVTGGTATTSNSFHVSHLRCGDHQFGILANCEKLRVASLIAPPHYTYFIDPDGPPMGKNKNNNQDPFLAYCVFNENPAYGITIIHHGSHGSFELGGSLSLFYLRVTVLQLKALKERSTFCTQDIQIDCRQFSLTYSGKTSTWTGLDQTDYVISDTLTTCTSPGGCRCDGSAGDSVDTGMLTDLAALPIESMDFSNIIGQLNSNPDAMANITIGPLKCSELFPTCADLFTFVKSKEDQGETLPESESLVTIDSDGAGPVPAFEVECRWPDDTVVTVHNPDDKLETNSDPKSQCFDVIYKDPNGDIITPEQLVALRDRSEKCFQLLMVNCTFARTHGMINYTTCDGVPQTGWAGSMGQDSCQCGVTGHCMGGKTYKCNCDLEDGQKRWDGAVIIRKDRLPVCKVCLSLDGIPTDMKDEIKKRSLKFSVSPLNCHSGKGRHVASSCQKERLKEKNKITQEQTEMVYMHERDPIPVGCRMFPKPPVGELEVFPYEQVHHNQSGNVTVTFGYYSVNMTILAELIMRNQYCYQKFFFFCMSEDDPEIDMSGDNGWQDINGNKHHSWTRMLPEEVDKDQECEKYPEQCKMCGSSERPRGYVVHAKSLLPITALSLNLPRRTTIIVETVRCLDLYETCYQIMKDTEHRRVKGSTYSIDPDGPGGVDPVQVDCGFNSKADCAITTVKTKSQHRKGLVRGKKKNPYDVKVSYTPNKETRQIQSLTNISAFCWQPVTFECLIYKVHGMNRKTNNTYSLSEQRTLSFGTGSDTDFEGCACGILDRCENKNLKCHCDAKTKEGEERRLDTGMVSRKELLPVTHFHFGEYKNGAYGRMAAGDIRCSNTDCNQFPPTCHEALTKRGKFKKNSVDYLRSGEFFIQPDPEVCTDPFLVYCEMDLDNKIGVTKILPRTAYTELRPGETTDVEYYGPTDEQMRCLARESKYCIQPVAYECYLAELLGGGAFWEGPEQVRQKIWGGGDGNNCACAADRGCGGLDSLTQQTNRQCNCDVMDARWRKDAGLLSNKDQLPVTYLDLQAINAAFNYSRVYFTVGELICSDVPIAFNECATVFHDCSEHATCIDEEDGYTCRCHKGWEGKDNTRVPGDDRPESNGRECVDDNECTFNVCPIGISDCANLPGSFECSCHAGFKKTGPVTCEDVDECATRKHNCDRNARCINQYGTYKCQCHKDFRGNGTYCYQVGSCAIFGDPHTLTFDGRWVNYQGVPECPLIAATDACGGEGSFQVTFTPWKQDPPRRGTGEFTWVKSLKIYMKGMVIEMLQDRIFTVDGVRKEACVTDRLRIFDTGQNLVLITDEGLEIYWDGEEEAEIVMPTLYTNRVCGMCGNFNGDATDDWIVGPQCNGTVFNSTHQTTENQAVFGNSWMIPSDTCVPSCVPVPPDTGCNVMSREDAQLLCGQVYSRTESIFKQCLKKLERRRIKIMKQSCEYDLCHAEGDAQVVICKHAMDVAEECVLNTQVDITGWEKEGLCDFQCENNRIFRSCNSDISQQDETLVTSCLELRAPGTSFVTGKGCVDGCHCPVGLLEENGRCVEEEDCGCLYNGDYITVGETVVTSTACNESVVCEQGGQVRHEPVECGPREECALKNGVQGCHCKDGYIRLNGDCVDDPCLTLRCTANAECVEGMCQCLPGYVGDCEKCEDEDECATGKDYCNERLHESCVNTDGSYYCACEIGYVRKGGRCQDVDECDLGIDKCPANSQCVNEEGGYACTCCVGYVKSRSECVWEGPGPEEENTTCCDCNGVDCSTSGQVCGSDDVTYPNIRALVVQSCQSGKNNVRPEYMGECETSCGQVQCLQPHATCEELPSGKVTCSCPSCSDINIQIINLVCASNNIIFRSECEFKAYMCNHNIIDIVIINDNPSACNGVGGGGVSVSSPEWSDCSTECGFGTVEGTVTINGVDVNLSAVCYSDCEAPTCANFQCSPERECIDTPNGAQCQCPPCGGEQTSPVCGMVGKESNATTFRNLCELKRAACLQHDDYYLFKHLPCQRQPENCGVMERYMIGTIDGNCKTQQPMNFPTCKGGCGPWPTDCCYKKEAEYDDYPFRCPDGSIENKQVELIISCECIPPEELSRLQGTVP